MTADSASAKLALSPPERIGELADLTGPCCEQCLLLIFGIAA